MLYKKPCNLPRLRTPPEKSVRPMSLKPGNACIIVNYAANAISSRAVTPKRSMPTTSKASGVIWISHWRLEIVPCDSNAIECTSAYLSHQSSIFKIHASVHVQLSPMTFCSARREALSQPTIGKPFKCAIYPSEAKRLFHYFDVRNSWPLGWTLTAISHHPTTFLCIVVLFEPMTKLRTIS